jgi:phage tail sheath protein FI
MDTFKTPGVYVREIATLPPSVAEVATAIPAFLGYTERSGGDVARITSMLEFQTQFGGAKPSEFTVRATTDPGTGAVSLAVVTPADKPSPAFLLYYCLSHYFLNGGGPCWVISVGTFDQTPQQADFTDGLNKLKQQDEPTIILFPDATRLAAADYAAVAQAALAQGNKLKDRFTILDVPDGKVTDFRDGMGINHLSYGAAYHPYLQTSLTYVFAETSVRVESAGGQGDRVTFQQVFGAGNGIVVIFVGPGGSAPKVKIVAGDRNGNVSVAIDGLTLAIGNAAGKTGTDIANAWDAWRASNADKGFQVVADGDGSGVVDETPAEGTPLPRAGGGTQTLDQLKTTQTALYNQVHDLLGRTRVVLPPSAAVAGVYASVDRDRGVWKAPANVSVAGVIGPTAKITDEEQEGLNVDVTAGKSINAIRDFTGKGTLVWGARTLAGNDNEWRYVPVRRLFLTIEESTKKASAFAVFEANDATTWLKVRGMIESYLYGLWERGALAGAKPETAYYVSVGLGRTMTPQDVLEGRLIVEIGVAAVRPAEFIVLRFMHKLQEA